MRIRHSTRAEDHRRPLLGAVPEKDGVNFAVWSPRSEHLIVHLFDRTDHEIASFKLPERRDGIWYGFAEGLKPGTLYALEAIGRDDPEHGYYFKEGRLLADPYAKALSKPFVWDEVLYQRNSAGFIPKSIVPDYEGTFDWQGISKPVIPRNGVILYEANVKGLTMLNREIPPSIRGTYLGIAHPAVIAHLKKLGITALQLNPVAACMSEPALAAKGLCNYWGYNPVCFMAPDPRFAQDPFKVVSEFKTMVRELHRSGIAVILDVVYNHTAEGGFGGPVLSLKGLDNHDYYAFEKDEEGERDYTRYYNVSGCGNSYNCDQMCSLNLVVDAMQYWLGVMQVDGFRFDLGVTLCRETHGEFDYEFCENSGFLKACFCEDLINGAILIAEPWDIGHEGYQVGHFPLSWSEQNDHFRDTVRRFWRGDKGLLSDLATRLMGSRDLFAKDLRPVNAAVNYITYHDGFTMEDLVSYDHKHNEANGWENNDGSEENFSCNHGVEGPTDDPKVLARRWQTKRNFMATLFFAQGTPHLLYGDEFSRTQQGNNNAYCQDNEISYLKWDYTEQNRQFIEYIAYLTKLRRGSRMLSEIRLKDDTFHLMEDTYEALWYQPNGMQMDAESWQDPQADTLMVVAGLKNSTTGEHWCLLLNQSEEEVFFTPPKFDATTKWTEMLDTSQPTGIPLNSDAAGISISCAPMSLKLLMLGSELQDFSAGGVTEPIRHGNRKVKFNHGRLSQPRSA